MQKDAHEHEDNVPLMREETSDGKVTTAGHYKVESIFILYCKIMLY